MPEKIRENLDKAIRSLQIADHMTYITFPLVNEKRLLLKIFDETYKSIIFCISALCEFEEQKYRKRVNFEGFLSNYAKNYGINSEDIKKIKEITRKKTRYNESAVDFVKKDRIVILSDDLSIESLDLKAVKEYLLTAKKLLMGANSCLKAKLRDF
jgi:hypothetical protein